MNEKEFLESMLQKITEKSETTKFGSEEECLSWIHKITSLKRGDEVVDTEGVRGVVLGFEKGGWVVTIGCFDKEEADIDCRGIPACCIKSFPPSPVEAPISRGFFIGIGTPIQTSTQERSV